MIFALALGHFGAWKNLVHLVWVVSELLSMRSYSARGHQDGADWSVVFHKGHSIDFFFWPATLRCTTSRSPHIPDHLVIPLFVDLSLFMPIAFKAYQFAPNIREGRLSSTLKWSAHMDIFGHDRERRGRVEGECKGATPLAQEVGEGRMR